MKKFISKFKNWNPSIYALILIGLTSFCVYLFCEFRLNNDFWFLIDMG